jgi:hypothetical protein
MALLTDGLISNIEDLTAIDSQLLEVASTEGLDVTRKLDAAQQEIQIEVEALIDRWRIRQVVATPALRMYHTYRTLEMIYADAYNCQLNDRYAGRRDQFHRKAKSAYDRLLQSGVAIAADPIPRSVPPLVTAIPGALPDGTYYVTMAWLNAAGEEGEPAVPVMFETISSSLMVHPGSAPANAQGWNVYVGAAPEAMTLQNASAIAVGAAWLQPGAILPGGRPTGSGQPATYVQAVPRLIPRG